MSSIVIGCNETAIARKEVEMSAGSQRIRHFKGKNQSYFICFFPQNNLEHFFQNSVFKINFIDFVFSELSLGN